MSGVVADRLAVIVGADLVCVSFRRARDPPGRHARGVDADISSASLSSRRQLGGPALDRPPDRIDAQAAGLHPDGSPPSARPCCSRCAPPPRSSACRRCRARPAHGFHPPNSRWRPTSPRRPASPSSSRARRRPPAARTRRRPQPDRARSARPRHPAPVRVGDRACRHRLDGPESTRSAIAEQVDAIDAAIAEIRTAVYRPHPRLEAPPRRSAIACSMSWQRPRRALACAPRVDLRRARSTCSSTAALADDVVAVVREALVECRRVTRRRGPPTSRSWSTSTRSPSPSTTTAAAMAHASRRSSGTANLRARAEQHGGELDADRPRSRGHAPELDRHPVAQDEEQP